MSCRSLVHHQGWLHNVAHGGDTYLCIKCGAQYTPWARSDELVLANKVCVVTDHIAHFFTRRVFEEAFLSVAVDREFLVGKSWPIIPVQWETTAEVDVYRQFRTIMMDKFADLRVLSPDAALCNFWDTVNVYKPKAAVFSEQPVSLEAVAQMDMYNMGQFSGVPLTDQHLQGQEPWGAVLSDDTILDKPLSERDFMLLWGLSVWLMHLPTSDA